MAELQGVCEHIHLPLQSGSDRVLRLMNRGYTGGDYTKKVEMLRENIPGIAITTDVIAGFPGESDTDHQDTIDVLREIGFDGIFAFKFSPRKGTRAYGIEGQIPDVVKAERLQSILELQEKITFAKNKTLEGTIQEILIEGLSETDSEMLMGRTRTNKIVTIPDVHEREGALVSVTIEKARQHSLYGRKIASGSDAA
jgi:tRNA-2-methylthio-N6-dimethylallyladenosine synthase